MWSGFGGFTSGGAAAGLGLATGAVVAAFGIGYGLGASSSVRDHVEVNHNTVNSPTSYSLISYQNNRSGDNLAASSTTVQSPPTSVSAETSPPAVRTALLSIFNQSTAESLGVHLRNQSAD